MTRPYREVGKSLALRTVELVHALQLTADSLGHICRGEIWHLIALSGQLRALLTERNRKADPLLLFMANVLQQELRLYCMPDVNDPKFPESLRDKLLFHVSGFPFTAERQFDAQLELSFSELLDLEIIFLRGKCYTIRTLIESYANNAGGAHYSRQLSEDFAELLAVDPLTRQQIANALVQIGNATLTAGRQLLKSVVDLEIHSLLVLPPQSSENLTDSNVLLDYRYEGSPMRLTLAVNNRLMPSFTVSGMQGVAARVESDRLINWSEPRLLYASLTIQDDLSTRLELAVDGAVVGRLVVKGPLFVLSDPLDYEIFHNRSVNGPAQQFSFGLCNLTMIGREISLLESANLILYMDQKRQDPDLLVVLYKPGSYAHAARGTKNLNMTGSVPRLKVSDVLSGTSDGVEDSNIVGEKGA